VVQVVAAVHLEIVIPARQELQAKGLLVVLT
jgi:hypothetical protein